MLNRIILMGVLNNICSTKSDVGAYGKDSDGGVLSNSSIYKNL